MDDLGSHAAARDPLRFLNGGGAMGDLIRSIDWSRSPLGPPEGWPQSLRTTLSLCLASNFPLCFVWGANRIQFYNDGYLPLCGAKHPHSLGQDYKECWASAWPVIGPGFERCTRTGETSFLKDARMFLDRNGYLEETFFSFSFSPIRDESDEIAGVFHPVVESTYLVLSERRLGVLRDLVAQTADAPSADDCLARIARALEAHPLDIPFALFYKLDGGGAPSDASGEGGPRLLAAVGVDAATSADALRDLPVEAFARHRTIDLDDHRALLGEIVVEPYPEAVRNVVAHSLTLAGAARPSVVMLVGASPRLPFDDGYRRFFDMLADAVTTAVSKAHAYAEERRRAEALAEIDRLKTSFFTNVSHEFRTPLTLMLGPVEDALTDDGEPPTPRLRTRLELIQRSALRLQKLVNTLLDFSRIEAGRVEASYEPTELASWTADLVSNFRSACESAGLRLEIACEKTPELVYIDRDLFEKAVLNLVSNAFKFTLSGSITVTLRKLSSTAEISVRDTGIGIAKSELPKLFERFHRVEGAHGRSVEGSGIGLALVREIVRLHGGDVRVESEVGKGSVFTLSIPLGAAHISKERIATPRRLPSTAVSAQTFVEEAARWGPENETQSRRRHSSAPPTNRSFAPRVLVADDNADMRDYVTRLLSESGSFDVRAVADGVDALESARKDPPDLIVSDVMMPKLDGFGLLRELRADFRTRDIPVVLLSARAGEEARIEGMKSGADDYLVKPFSGNELVARVVTLLELIRARKSVADANLRESEHRFRVLAAALPQIVWIAKPDGKITYLNDQWEAYTGVRGHEREDELEIIHPEDRAKMRQRWGEAVRAETVFTHEFRMRRRGASEYRWFLARAVPTRSPGKPEGEWFGTSTDIHDLKMAETAVRESHRHFRELVEGLPQLAWTTKPDGECDYVSPQWVAYTGNDSATQVERGWIEAIHPDDIAETKRAWSESIARRSPHEVEHRIRRADGVYRWFHSRAVPLRGPDDVLVRWFGTSSDIEDRRRADEALRTSEQRFRSMFELAAVGIAQSDARSGRLLLCNDKLCKITGYSRDELSAISQNEAVPSQGAVPSEDDAHLTLFAKALVGDGRASINEKLFLRKDGAPVWVRINAAAMRDAAGVLLTVLYVIEDVTARKHAEEKLQRFNAVLEGLVRGRTVELEAANKELEAFAYSVSHDLRAPLRAIEGFSRILSERFASEMPEAARDYLADVRSNTAYMGRLVSDLLAFSRLGRQPVRKITVDTNEVVRGCLADVNHAREGRTVDVVLGDLPPCDADPFLLKQVFVNLLSNAFKYTSKRPTARVELGTLPSPVPGQEPGASASSDEITFFVKDDGVGFDMRYAHKLFAVFRRLHSAEEYEGTGVGLAIVQRIVLRHGGRVWADAAPDRGATFFFTLPRAGVAHDGE